MNPLFDTFIFDLDGTLLDTLPDLVVNTNMALTGAGFEPRSTDEIHSYVGDGLKPLIHQALPDGVDEKTVEDVMNRWKSLYLDYGSCLTKEYSGMTDLIKELRSHGAKTAVLSNKFDQGVQQLIDLHFPNLFDVAHGESKTILRKPNPQGLLYTIKELASLPELSAYVGDSLTDIVTSHQANVFSIAVAWGYHRGSDLAAAGADFLAQKPEDILAFVQK